jgi:RimJ/RimL family protein N-acetyltransferase
VIWIELTRTPENIPTRALAAQLGFAEEGLQRQRNIERGRRVDFVLFGLLADDWAVG